MFLNSRGIPTQGKSGAGIQSSCSLGTTQIGLVLMVIFLEWSSWLLISSTGKTDFILVLLSCPVLWLSCIFGFQNHFSNYFSRQLHSLVCEMGFSSSQVHHEDMRFVAPSEPKVKYDEKWSAAIQTKFPHLLHQFLCHVWYHQAPAWPGSIQYLINISSTSDINTGTSQAPMYALWGTVPQVTSQAPAHVRFLHLPY